MCGNGSIAAVVSGNPFSGQKIIIRAIAIQPCFSVVNDTNCCIAIIYGNRCAHRRNSVTIYCQGIWNKTEDRRGKVSHRDNLFGCCCVTTLIPRQPPAAQQISIKAGTVFACFTKICDGNRWRTIVSGRRGSNSWQRFAGNRYIGRTKSENRYD